jgi:hypothetical protein
LFALKYGLDYEPIRPGRVSSTLNNRTKVTKPQVLDDEFDLRDEIPGSSKSMAVLNFKRSTDEGLHNMYREPVRKKPLRNNSVLESPDRYPFGKAEEETRNMNSLKGSFDKKSSGRPV